MPATIQFRDSYQPGFSLEILNLQYIKKIIPSVLYGSETWSFTLREEKKLRIFENKILRKIFGPKRGEQTGEWRKAHNVELHNSFGNADIISKLK